MKKELFKYTKLNLNDVFSEFYDTILSSPDMAVFFKNDEQIRSLIEKQKTFLLETILLEDDEIRSRYISLGEMHHNLKIPYADFSASVSILEQAIIQNIVKNEKSPSKIINHTFHFFRLVRAYTAKGYLNLLLESDIRDIDRYLSNVNSTTNVDSVLATERIIWLKNVIFAIKVENRAAAPSLQTPPEIIDIIKVATRKDDEIQHYALDMTSRIELTARNIFFFINKKSYGEVLPLYKELMSIYKLTLMLVNVMTVITTESELEGLKRDPLTKLLTRHTMPHLMKRELAISVASGYSIALVMLDIDHFKEVNDKHGHIVGDKVLKDVANISTSYIRSTDYAYRFGGEEFLLVLKGASLEVAYTQAEIIRQQIENLTFNDGEASFNVTASFGVAHFSPPFTKDIYQMTDIVDKKLYTAKKSGRNIVVK